MARPSTRRHRSLRADEGGSIAVEFALVLPALLLLVFGVIEFGRLLWVDNTLRHAVQEGARCAAMNCCESSGACSSPQGLAAQRATGLGLTAADFVLETQDCGKRLVAGATGDGVSYEFMLGDLIGFLGVDLTLRAQACFPTLDR
jgi:hypothetical protein